MSDGGPIGGTLKIRPGRPRPHSLVSSRRDWAGMLARGQPAGAIPGILAGIFSLCGHAHRLCAGMAILAAAQRADDRPTGAGAALQIETMREHARHICLVWPGRLAAAASRARTEQQGGIALRCCPVLRAPAHDAAALQSRDWVERHILGMDAVEWLAAWAHDPRQWMSNWCEMPAAWLPALLRDCRPLADFPVQADPPLRPHAMPSRARELCKALRDGGADFPLRPQWSGACAETGTWTRLHDRPAMTDETPWLRLGARLADLARLCLPASHPHGGAHWLAHGCLEIAPGEGLGWVEMARGLLVHHVQLDRPSIDARASSFRVVAPTEWNFHPDGAVARALAAMPCADAADTRRRVSALMTAYDPCVDFDIDLQPSEPERAHA